MTENRQKLLDRIIRIYGYEHEITIDFAKMCENYLNVEIFDKTLEALVKCHEEYPYTEDDE